ncbi:GGDEF domain-containing protein [Alteromonas sp. KUL49]|uniref:GGDEF domain-containing protein n=1 Tax=Alteromonas sp. KUL49 TaxID=2480798 RepID=UPI00102EEFEE|nr:GGDEF domain-containing protein [Alteromonas sp. KUL49]TAP39636.1 GGDEF domain-containing protein [Alteromonas sp. KUL49]GEA11615.1 diguanylate cyclase [Alteromonas sp. KUL49]
MDFSTTIYDSTEDNNYYPSTKAAPTLSANAFNNFVLELLSTIELETLGAVYHKQLANFLPLEGLSLTDLDSRWVYGRASNPRQPITLHVSYNSLQGTERSNVYYYFTRPLTIDQRQILDQCHGIFARQVAHALELMRMRQMATKDVLTGLGNRSGYDQAVDRVISQSSRSHKPFALLMIDLDNFKSVNDTHGHREGDKVLVTVASLLSQSLRNGDEAFRFGGDEFCCILDCSQQQQLASAAARIQKKINSSKYLTKLNVSCSIGGAISRDNDDAHTIFDRADTALYKVKESGKNSYRAA